MAHCTLPRKTEIIITYIRNRGICTTTESLFLKQPNIPCLSNYHSFEVEGDLSASIFFLQITLHACLHSRTSKILREKMVRITKKLMRGAGHYIYCMYVLFTNL